MLSLAGIKNKIKKIEIIEYVNVVTFINYCVIPARVNRLNFALSKFIHNTQIQTK